MPGAARPGGVFGLWPGGAWGCLWSGGPGGVFWPVGVFWPGLMYISVGVAWPDAGMAWGCKRVHGGVGGMRLHGMA